MCGVDRFEELQCFAISEALSVLGDLHFDVSRRIIALPSQRQGLSDDLARGLIQRIGQLCWLARVGIERD
jgi:hypothetical protein